MKIGIIACETFKRQLEILTEGDPDIVYKEYLEFGLHEFPDELKKVVTDKVNSLAGKVDAVLLAYGICNSLKDVAIEAKVPTYRLNADDCIGVLLTQDEYNRERKICAGTMYHTPYFAEMGNDFFIKNLKKRMPNYEEVGLDVDWYLDKLFDGYKRVLYIDDGLGDKEKYMELSRKWAEGRKLAHESRTGTLSCLEEGLLKTKELAKTSVHA
jgi:hypothetical protein